MDLCTGVTVGRDVSSLRSGECLRLSEQAMEWFHQQLRGYQSSIKRLCLSLGPPAPYLPRFNICSSWPRAASLPGMWERTLTIGSAGKSFSATGWKVSVVPRQVTAAGGLRKAPLAEALTDCVLSRWAGSWVQIGS